MRTAAYRDSAGLLTIGVGHLLTRSELMSGKITTSNEKVRWADGITGAQVFAIFDIDNNIAENAVELYAPGLSDARFDALVSFVFNVGVAAFAGSTLLKKIHARKLDDVPQQLLRWNRAAGVVVAGLVERRKDEAALWELGS